ncbi:LuxR C-terminal-related transcriptional regulator [Streptomyces sp. NPDC046887]|uniref:helix-turn-helix transcriptional regulator n=1 Tax=Streptomyces sp. NPDC046887 TaxID=3155472 RepID=UPI0033EC4B98
MAAPHTSPHPGTPNAPYPTPAPHTDHPARPRPAPADLPTPRTESPYPYRTALFDRAGMAVTLLDRTGRIREANPAAERLLRRTPGTLTGTSLSPYLGPETHTALWRRLLSGPYGYVHTTVPLTLPGHRLPAVQLVAWLVPPGHTAAEAVCCLLPPSGPAPDAPPPAVHPALSAVEVLIVEGLALGLSNAELGRELHLSRQGLDYHIGRLRQKFGARSRTALVARAYATGLLTPGTWPPHVAGAAPRPLAPGSRPG